MFHHQHRRHAYIALCSERADHHVVKDAGVPAPDAGQPLPRGPETQPSHSRPSTQWSSRAIGVRRSPVSCSLRVPIFQFSNSTAVVNLLGMPCICLPAISPDNRAKFILSCPRGDVQAAQPTNFQAGFGQPAARALFRGPHSFIAVRTLLDALLARVKNGVRAEYRKPSWASLRHSRRLATPRRPRFACGLTPRHPTAPLRFDDRATVSWEP